MSVKPIIPSVSEILAPGINKLAELRPNSVIHLVNPSSIYNHIFTGIASQVKIILARLADEALNSRLPTANGEALRELVASEFETDRLFVPTYGYGEVFLTRSSTGAGVIPEGTRFARAGSTISNPIPVKAAEYVSTAPVVVNTSDTIIGPIKIRAVTQGSFSNTVIETYGGVLQHDTSIKLADIIFDLGPWTTLVSFCCGGSDSTSDDVLRLVAQANDLGKFGPTKAALLAGALNHPGVARAVILEDSTAVSRVFLTDSSWGNSTFFLNQVKQYIKDNYEGFGCQSATYGVLNQYIKVSATVKVRSPSYLSDKSEIDKAIYDTIRKYMDNRSDFYVWKSKPLRGLISRCSHKILHCTGITIQDKNGNTLTEPTAPSVDSTYLTHYYLPENSVSITYTSPS